MPDAIPVKFLPLILFAAACMVGVAPTRAGVLTSESVVLPSGNASGPYIDMIVDTSPLTAWGQKGAVGLQGPKSIFPSGSGYVNPPAATVALKFNIGATVDSLNASYGTGNWTIANPRLTFQYTYYANNSIFGGGAGSFDTYWIANDNWAFGNGGPANNAYGDSTYVAGTDPVYATDVASLRSWAGTEADLGTTTYNWLSPSNNPNYTGSWSTAKVGPNQGLLTANLAADPLLVHDITSATAASNPNVSLYLMPTTETLGLTIFTGGGSVTPELSFDVVSVPEPLSVSLAAIGIAFLWRRRRE